MSFITSFAQSEYYTYADSSTMDSAATAGMVMAVYMFFFFVVVISYVITAILMSRIFKKAGVEGWKAWVPVYNSWVMLELGGQKGFWAILAFIPVVNIVSAVFMIIAMYYIGLKFGKEGVFVLLAIFVPIVWLAWLAFDKSTWNGHAAVQPVVTEAAPSPGSPTVPTDKPSDN